MPDLKDIQLLASLKNGEKSAINILFKLYHSPLCLMAFRLLRDRDAAKDVVQDVFIKVWNNRQSIEIHYSWSAYLRRSVINTSLNYLERNQRHPHVDLEALTVHPTVSPADQHQTFSELTNQVDDAIQNLPIRTRTVFVLIRQEEMSYKEVGESLQISTKAVEKEMMKALRLLRQNLRNFLPSLMLVGLIV